MKVEVTRYRKPDGYASRYWAVMVDGELLAVTVYRRGSVAVANLIQDVQYPTDPVHAGTVHANASAGPAPETPDDGHR